VSGLSGVVAISAGGSHSCALLSDATVRCWGRNVEGQLGSESIVSAYFAIPVAVTGLTGVSAVDAGGYHTCALISGGAVRCWGNNMEGELGNGLMSNSTLATTVNGLTGDVLVIAAGTTHTCALLSAGSVTCWGQNLAGQLGNGSTTSSLVPVVVLGW
jgi:alpha-tubulin suppressor-like RCC1 family protein